MAKISGRPTLSQALAQAQHFDVIVATAFMYQPYVAQMHAVNPNLVILAYENSTFLDKGTDPNGTHEPDSWYLKNCVGHKLRAKGYGSWLMDPRNVRGAWFDDRVATAQNLLASSGYDGIFLDMLGPYPTSGTYVYDATTGALSRPAIPGSSPCANWADLGWMDATGALAQRIRSVTGKTVWGNGINTGTAYFAKPTSHLQPYTDGLMAEAFVRGSANAVNAHWNETAWKRDVDMLVDAASRGEPVLAITKLWVPATSAQIATWHEYSLATFLLGAGPTSFFQFRSNTSLSPDDPWCRTALGAPLGPYAKTGSVYRRDFAGGRVLVNPTTGAVTVDLGGGFVTLAGNRVASITLQPHTAAILTTA